MSLGIWLKNILCNSNLYQITKINNISIQSNYRLIFNFIRWFIYLTISLYKHDFIKCQIKIHLSHYSLLREFQHVFTVIDVEINNSKITIKWSVAADLHYTDPLKLNVDILVTFIHIINSFFWFEKLFCEVLDDCSCIKYTQSLHVYCVNRRIISHEGIYR